MSGNVLRPSTARWTKPVASLRDSGPGGAVTNAGGGGYRHRADRIECVVRPHGELGALFLSEPHTGFTNGLPEKKRKPEPVDHWREAVKALNEAIAEARHNCETARSLFALASYGRRGID
jgi:hypothetical protein